MSSGLVHDLQDNHHPKGPCTHILQKVYIYIYIYYIYIYIYIYNIYYIYIYIYIYIILYIYIYLYLYLYSILSTWYILWSKSIYLFRLHGPLGSAIWPQSTGRADISCMLLHQRHSHHFFAFFSGGTPAGHRGQCIKAAANPITVFPHLTLIRYDYHSSG